MKFPLTSEIENCLNFERFRSVQCNGKKNIKEKKLVRKYNSLTIIFLAELLYKPLILVVNTKQLNYYMFQFT